MPYWMNGKVGDTPCRIYGINVVNSQINANTEHEYISYSIILHSTIWPKTIIEHPDGLLAAQMQHNMVDFSGYRTRLFMFLAEDEVYSQIIKLKDLTSLALEMTKGDFSARFQLKFK